MTTLDERPVTTDQQLAAAALVAILATPGLAPASWTIYPDRVRAELVGQINRHSITEARAAVDAYTVALELAPLDDQHVPGGAHCDDFTKVWAQGTYMGATVRVWCAADEDATGGATR